jgi:hypothetical protein
MTSPSARQPSHAWSGYLIFTLGASFYLLPFMRFMFLGADEGTLLVGAVRIIHGQVFARDFFELMGPGTFYWLAAFYKLFGVTILARGICLFVSSFGTAISIYFLTRRVCSRYQTLPCMVLAGIYFGAAWPGISHHVDSNFFGLLSVVCMILWHQKRWHILLIASGALAGVTACILQPKGVLLLCAFLAWLWIQNRRVTPPLFSLGLVTGGFLAVLGTVLLYFWSQGALGSLVYTSFIFPAHHYSAVNHVAYAQGIFKDYWNLWLMELGPSAWSYGIASILILPLLFVVALPLLLLGLASRYKWRSATPEIILYCLAGWAMWIAELHRRDIYHLVFGSPLLIILLVHALSGSRRKLVDLGLQALSICAVCLAGFNCLIVSAAAHPSETRVGSVHLLGSDPTLKFIDEHVAPGEDIFVYPYLPTYYFLTATTNPTPYSFLMYNYNTPSQFQEAVQILDQRRVKFVVWDTTFESRVEKEVFPGSQTASANDLILEPYLSSHYKVVENYRGIQIMERR